MRAPDGSGRCRDAEEYYYDLLERDGDEVPEAIRRHVETCPFCREQIARLREALAQAVDPGDRLQEGIAETLTRHFARLGDEIGCCDVRPFLPSLLLSSPQVHIPTPITVHVDQCQACADDLATLRQWDLTDDQLCRLSRLYGTSPDQSLLRCAQVQPQVPAIASLSFDDIDPADLAHASECPYCRIEVFRHRQVLLSAARQSDSSEPDLACDDITAADLFDLVVPYDLPDADGLHDRRLAGHVCDCPACLRRLQELHHSVYGIMDRPDSPITTVYRVQDHAATDSERREENRPHYPVEVDVFHDAPTASEIASRARRTVGAIRAKLPADPRLAPAAATLLSAAAMIVLVLALLPSGSTVTATSSGELAEALRQATNVHVVKTAYVGPNAQPEVVQKIWAARDAGRYLDMRNLETALYDLSGGWKRTIEGDEGDSEQVTTRDLTRLEREQLQLRLANLAPLAFQNLPPAAELDTVSAGEAAEGLAVYEVPVASRADGGMATGARLRIFADPDTKLPVRIEYFRSEQGETQSLVSVTKFEYLTAEEMAAAIQREFPSQ